VLAVVSGLADVGALLVGGDKRGGEGEEGEGCLDDGGHGGASTMPVVAVLKWKWFKWKWSKWMSPVEVQSRSRVVREEKGNERAGYCRSVRRVVVCKECVVQSSQ
jgi:hypothetical protein